MKSSAKHVQLTSVDDLFTTEESRIDDQREKVMEIPLAELHPFENHPFKVLDDDRMLDTAQSIREHGVLVPAIARLREEGGYELVAGHRRKRACELAGLETMPVIVRKLDDDEATIIMVDSNIQRESLLPSERAFAYRMKLEALKRQGARSDLTSAQVGQKLTARAQVAKEAGESSGQIQRLIRLTELIRPLLNMTARGFIWYQGESNVHTNNYPHYAHYMEKLVSQWRGDWGDPDMPFYFVQLVPHIYEGGTDGIVLPLMIEQQLAAADRIPNCAMIGTSDMANAGTIHPSEKDQIGRRLALLALTKTYGLQGLIAESPRFESVRFEGGKAILQFKTEGTLGPNYKGRIKGFEIAGADKVFIPARAEYVWGQPYTVVVSSELVSEPVAVRYAFRNVPAAATLTNTGGLPAFPFRTDDWNDVK